jgi:hypothetical protein
MIAPSLLSYVYLMVHINDKYKKKRHFTVRSRFISLMICLTVEVVNCFSQPVQNEMKSLHIYWYAHELRQYGESKIMGKRNNVRKDR